MMTQRFRGKTAAAAVGLLMFLAAGLPDSPGATTFIGSTIERVEPDQQRITFRTREGQSWTLEVADDQLLHKEPLAKGDQVSIEIGANDKVTKIVKLGAR